jgi:hypothetical protein
MSVIYLSVVSAYTVRPLTTLNLNLSFCGLRTKELWGNAHKAGFRLVTTPSSLRSRLATALFRAPKTWTCHLANQRRASSHAQRAGSVYKAAGWSTRNSVLDASLSYVYNGISSGSKISTNRPGSNPPGRPLIHPGNQHDPAGSKPSTAGRLDGLAASNTSNY